MLDFWLKQTHLTLDEHELTFNARNRIEDSVAAFGAAVISRCGPIPRHIAFCMDGNRRYAKRNSLQAGRGHIDGFASMMHICAACSRMGVEAVTVYAFSIENFNRSPEESEVLFRLVRTKLWNMVKNEHSAITKCGWKVVFHGRRSLLEPDLIERISSIEEATAHNPGMVLNICAPYTTRDDLAHAVAEVTACPNIDCTILENHRYLASAPPLDLLIRTSGETRFSDFMVWEADSDCTIEFVPQLWPEFTVWNLFTVIIRWQIAQKKLPHSLSRLRSSPPQVSVAKRPPPPAKN